MPFVAEIVYPKPPLRVTFTWCGHYIDGITRNQLATTPKTATAQCCCNETCCNNAIQAVKHAQLQKASLQLAPLISPTTAIGQMTLNSPTTATGSWGT